MTEFPQSEIRVGDAEREEGLRALGEHMSAGRLTIDEYGERSAKVTTAATRGDLLALFADLPEPRPRLGVVARPTPTPTFAAPPPPMMAPPRMVGRTGRPLSILMPIAMVIGLFMLFRFGFFPGLFLPIVILFLVGRRGGHHPRRGWH